MSVCAGYISFFGFFCALMERGWWWRGRGGKRLIYQSLSLLQLFPFFLFSSSNLPLFFLNQPSKSLLHLCCCSPCSRPICIELAADRIAGAPPFESWQLSNKLSIELTEFLDLEMEMEMDDLQVQKEEEKEEEVIDSCAHESHAHNDHTECPTLNSRIGIEKGAHLQSEFSVPSPIL